MEAASNIGELNPDKIRRHLTPEKRRLARKRWEILINVLTSRKCDVEPSISVRRFASFGLLQTEALEHDTELMTNSITGEQIEKRHIWYKFTCDEFPQLTAVVRYLDGVLDVSDVLGFNNTGNVCVWPSEEVLTYYCLKHIEMFKDKSICELGGGMTCLAGIGVALCSEAHDVLLTDGNHTSVESDIYHPISEVNEAELNNKYAAHFTWIRPSLLMSATKLSSNVRPRSRLRSCWLSLAEIYDDVNKIIQRNESSFGSTTVTARADFIRTQLAKYCLAAHDVLGIMHPFTEYIQPAYRKHPSFISNYSSELRWDDVPKGVCSRYDTIICADCLFFDEYRLDLISVIDKLLKPGGNVIIFAPSRGKTFQQFKDLLASRFLNVTQQERYDELVWDLHLKNLARGTGCYDPDLHYPLMLTFNKGSSIL